MFSLHSSDRPWITNKIKLYIGKRQSPFFVMENARKLGVIRTAKYNYYQNKVAEVEQVNPSKWWREI